MASIVANYFLEMREQDDGLGITAVFAFVNLLGAARAETDKRLLTAHDSGDPAQVITTLDYGIHAYMTTNGFYKAHIIEPLREINRPPEATRTKSCSASTAGFARAGATSSRFRSQSSAARISASCSRRRS